MAKRKKNINKSSLKKKTIKLEEKPIKSLTIKDFYFNNIKKLVYIPFILLLISFLIIGQKYVTTGDFVNKGVSLSGGVSLTITSTSLDFDQLELDIKDKFGNLDFSLRKITGAGEQKAIIVESAEINPDELSNFLKTKYSLTNDDITLEQTGSTLGNRFFKQTGNAILMAFFFMAIVVYIYFRTLIPSFAIVLAAFSNMVMTLAVFNLLGLKLTTAGIAAFLMLIGYSVDTDILLSTRVLKRSEGTVNDRIMDAMKTGFTMNITTLAAVSVALFISQSEVLTQIMTILLIGLFADMLNTWIQNAGILKIYVDKGEKK